MSRSSMEAYMYCLGNAAEGKKGIVKVAGNVEIGKAKKYMKIAEKRNEVVITNYRGVVYSITDAGLRLLEDWKKYQDFSDKLKIFLGEIDAKKRA